MDFGDEAVQKHDRNSQQIATCGLVKSAGLQKQKSTSTQRLIYRVHSLCGTKEGKTEATGSCTQESDLYENVFLETDSSCVVAVADQPRPFSSFYGLVMMSVDERMEGGATEGFVSFSWTFVMLTREVQARLEDILTGWRAELNQLQLSCRISLLMRADCFFFLRQVVNKEVNVKSECSSEGGHGVGGGAAGGGAAVGAPLQPLGSVLQL